ncbi:MAG: RNA 2',3'-cyclic phosphodiesterase [Deltaproteobacteria bacterium]|nr:RNA 2',3'-cyclic phosphodiesterase [Deltaproteobacteria bacterium]
MIRAFLAIDLPENLKPGLALLLQELKKSGADVKWVPPGNVHLTLKFFGNVPDADVEALAQAAQEVAAAQAPFQLKVTGAGAFPNLNAPRVVWLGLEGEMAALGQLFRRLEKVFEKLGFPPEDRAFHPHLTLGRVKSPQGRFGLTRALKELPAPDWPAFQVKELILYRSVLSPHGSTYTLLQVIPLGKL